MVSGYHDTVKALNINNDENVAASTALSDEDAVVVSDVKHAMESDANEAVGARDDEESLVVKVRTRFPQERGCKLSELN